MQTLEKKEYLDFDLSFLDKKNKNAKLMTSETFKPKSQPNWMIYAIVGIIGIFILNYLTNNSPNNIQSNATKDSGTVTTTKSGTIKIGNYRCTQYHVDEAQKLMPNQSIIDKLNSRRDELDDRQAKLQKGKTWLANNKPSRYAAQNTIDTYNKDVDNYNSFLAQFKSDLKAYDNDVKYYLGDVQTYLNNNCNLER